MKFKMGENTSCVEVLEQYAKEQAKAESGELTLYQKDEENNEPAVSGEEKIREEGLMYYSFRFTADGREQEKTEPLLFLEDTLYVGEAEIKNAVKARIAEASQLSKEPQAPNVPPMPDGYPERPAEVAKPGAFSNLLFKLFTYKTRSRVRYEEYKTAVQKFERYEEGKAAYEQYKQLHQQWESGLPNEIEAKTKELKKLNRINDALEGTVQIKEAPNPIEYDPSADLEKIREPLAEINRKIHEIESANLQTHIVDGKEKAEPVLNEDQKAEYEALKAEKKKLLDPIESQIVMKKAAVKGFAKPMVAKEKYLNELINNSNVLKNIARDYDNSVRNAGGEEQLGNEIRQYLSEHADTLEASVEREKVPYTAEEIQKRCQLLYIHSKEKKNWAEIRSNGGSRLEADEKQGEKQAEKLPVPDAKTAQERDKAFAKLQEETYARLNEGALREQNMKHMAQEIKPSELRQKMKAAQSIVADPKKSLEEIKAAADELKMNQGALKKVPEVADEYLKGRRTEAYLVLAEKGLSADEKRAAIAQILVCNSAMQPQESLVGTENNGQPLEKKDYLLLRTQQDQMSEQFLEGGNKSDTFRKWTEKIEQYEPFRKAFASEAALNEKLSSLMAAKDSPAAFLEEKALLLDLLQPEQKQLGGNEPAAVKNKTAGEKQMQFFKA